MANIDTPNLPQIINLTSNQPTAQCVGSAATADAVMTGRGNDNTFKIMSSND